MAHSCLVRTSPLCYRPTYFSSQIRWVTKPNRVTTTSFSFPIPPDGSPFAPRNFFFDRHMMHQPNRFCPPINIYASAQYMDDTEVDVLFQVVTTAKTGPLIPRHLPMRMWFLLSWTMVAPSSGLKSNCTQVTPNISLLLAFSRGQGEDSVSNFVVMTEKQWEIKWRAPFPGIQWILQYLIKFVFCRSWAPYPVVIEEILMVNSTAGFQPNMFPSRPAFRTCVF